MASACSPESEKQVELGFVEKTLSWKLRCRFFRSKVGGKPPWLALENLPESSSLQCNNCKKPYALLLQIYAPVDNVADAFHRSIFVFACTDGRCSKRNCASNFVVFRSQLPLVNQYYDSKPYPETEEGSDVPSAAQYATLCDICGCKSSISCASCCNRNYCGEAHRVLDWEAGHKSICGAELSVQNNSKKKKKNKQPRCLLPEYELVTCSEELSEEEEEKSEEEKMREYQQFMKSAKAKSCVQDGQFDDVENFGKKPDKAFNKFRKRVALEPEQVVRYDRCGVPLWVSSEHQPSSADIPNCPCGAKRVFEFQVMPQLLNYLSLDTVDESVDWGTLIVYTCSESCSLGTSAYVQEFIWKQDFSSDVERR